MALIPLIECEAYRNLTPEQILRLLVVETVNGPALRTVVVADGADFYNCDTATVPISELIRRLVAYDDVCDCIVLKTSVI